MQPCHHLFLLLGERHGALYCNRRLSVHCICFCNLFLLHLLQKVMVIDCWLIYKTRTTDIWNFDSLTLFITIRYIKGFFSGGNLDWKDAALKTTFLKVNYLRFQCREEGSLDTALDSCVMTRQWQTKWKYVTFLHKGFITPKVSKKFSKKHSKK